MIAAGDRYNHLMARVTSGSVSEYQHERISRIQRDIARHQHKLDPGPISDAYQQALDMPNHLSERDGEPLDDALAFVQCIKAGEAYLALFEQIQFLNRDAEFTLGVGRLNQENSAAFVRLLALDRTAEEQAHAAENEKQ